jgi:hypothetical protein
MKICAKLLILSATLIGMATMIGCNKPQEITDTAKSSVVLNIAIM